MEDIAIKIEGISKKYSVGKEKDGSLRGTLNGLFKKNASSSEDFWALKDVSFEVKKGEVIGIIGKNGAGKSTLLKILSQITKPTEGRIEINGRVASLLEVGTGFHPELTGRENIYLNGTILGMSRKEVKAKFDEIVAFSGVKKFIDTPVKHYSSGMYVRLAFAVAAHLEPEILIIDEVLAVGDAEFQKKCLGKMRDVSKEGRTVIFVSHNLSAMAELCSKSILLKQGYIDSYDKTSKIIDKYVKGNGEANLGIRKGLRYVMFDNITFFKKNKEVVQFQSGEKINIFIKLKISETFSSKYRIGISLHNSLGDIISINYSSYYSKWYESQEKVRIEDLIFPLMPGEYFLKGIIQDEFENILDWPDFNLHEFTLLSTLKNLEGNNIRNPILLNFNWK